jgi:hypothetical protein
MSDSSLPGFSLNSLVFDESPAVWVESPEEDNLELGNEPSHPFPAFLSSRFEITGN